MKNVLRVVGIGLALVFVVAQFFRSPRNTGVAEGPDSLVAREKVPAEVRAILRRSCYDCHSDNTVYPWYASVQPVAWWLHSHVSEGRAELNLSQFSAYDTKRAVRKLQAVADEVHERHMPRKSYLLLHRDAKPSDADVALVTNWAEELAEEIESR
jgi:hypothetical protein